MIVYVLTENEASEGGSVVGVYPTEEKAREEGAKLHIPSADKRGRGVFYWEIVPIEVDSPVKKPHWSALPAE